MNGLLPTDKDPLLADGVGAHDHQAIRVAMHELSGDVNALPNHIFLGRE
jgi:hypothetical protein